MGAMAVFWVAEREIRAGIGRKQGYCPGGRDVNRVTVAGQKED